MLREGRDQRHIGAGIRIEDVAQPDILLASCCTLLYVISLWYQPNILVASEAMSEHQNRGCGSTWYSSSLINRSNGCSGWLSRLASTVSGGDRAERNSRLLHESLTIDRFVEFCPNKTQRIESKIARKWLLKLKMFKTLHSQNSQKILSSLPSWKAQNSDHAKSWFVNTHMTQNDAIISILVTQKNS